MELGMKYVKVEQIYYDYFFNILFDHLGHQFTVWKNDFREQKRAVADPIELGVEDI